jgi:hypothetical protein
MMNGPEKSDLAIVAMKPANKANEPTAEASTGANAAEPVERRAGAKGNAHQQSTHWTQSQARVSQALERIRQAIAVIHPRLEPYARESRTYGSVRGRDENRVPTATPPRVQRAHRQRGRVAARGARSNRRGMIELLTESFVDSLRCRNLEAIGVKRTCQGWPVTPKCLQRPLANFGR